MIHSLETLRILNWHPDAGVWPLVAVSLVAVVLIVWPRVRGGVA